jgi:serine/threonine protein kinase
MGEVYRARDTRLDREVAIKVLPSEIAGSPERRQRLQREARAISSLSHSNICTLYDVGHQDGIDFLVMEYLEGETLERRLERGPLAPAQAVRIGCQIADALDKAHRKGFIHRDLKPGNIMLTKSGAKLLDFGLAKPPTLAQTDTMTALTMGATALSPKPLTTEGTIVGTFQYMAPEQLEGRDADARSDIFALGAVLYEAVTGRQAFTGKSTASVIAAILAADPTPMSQVQPMTPVALERVVRTCLAKDPDERFQTAHDVKLALEWSATEAPKAPASEDVGKRRKLWPLYLAAAALAALLFAAGAWIARLNTPTLPVIRSSILPPLDNVFAFSDDFGGPPVLSPDGKALVYLARNNVGQKQLWLRPLNSANSQPIEGTENAAFPFWSPDSRSIGFFADGKLKRIVATGGTPTVLADAPNARGGTWSRDNVIVYSPDFVGPLWRVGAEGGAATQVTKLDQTKHTTHRWPVFLPDGMHFLYFAAHHTAGRPEHNGIYFQSLSDNRPRFVVATDSDPIYAAGFLLYHSGEALLVQRLNASNGTLSGEALPVVQKVGYAAGIWHVMATAGDNGMLAYQAAIGGTGSELTWFDRRGVMLGKVGDRQRYQDPRLSPDGRKLAVRIGDPGGDLYIIDLERGVNTRLTFESLAGFSPVWSPDGKRIAYSVRTGAQNTVGSTLHVKDASGGGPDEVLFKPDDPGETVFAESWTSDGKYLLFRRQSGPSGSSLWALPMQDKREPFLVLKPETAQGNILQAATSPDSKWLAYVGNDSGRNEVYVIPFPKGAGKWQLSNGGGTNIIWGADGRQLYFRRNDLMLASVDIDTRRGDFQFGSPQPLFRMNAAAAGLTHAVSTDGKRILVNNAPEDTSTPLTLVVNWTAELKR